jgi:hypothetical protein
MERQHLDASTGRAEEATMEIDRRDTAVVFTDPQNEVLSETGQGLAVGTGELGGEQHHSEHGPPLRGHEAAWV